MSKFCASLRLAAPEPSTVGGLHHIPSRPGRLAAPHTHDRRLRGEPCLHRPLTGDAAPAAPHDRRLRDVPLQAAHRRCAPSSFPPRPPARNRSPLPAVPITRRATCPSSSTRRPWHSPGAQPWHGLPAAAHFVSGITARSLPARLRAEVTLLTAVRGLLPSGAQPLRNGIHDYKNAPCSKGATPAVRPNQAR